MDSQPGILSLRFWLFGIFLINLFCLLMRFVRCRKRAEQGRVSDFRYFFLVNLILFCHWRMNHEIKGRPSIAG